MHLSDQTALALDSIGLRTVGVGGDVLLRAIAASAARTAPPAGLVFDAFDDADLRASLPRSPSRAVGARGSASVQADCRAASVTC